MEQNTKVKPPFARRYSRKWSNTQANTLQTREKALRIGGKSKVDNSNYETRLSQMEQNTKVKPPNARRYSRKWSIQSNQTLQTRDDTIANGAYDGNKPSKRERGCSCLENLKFEWLIFIMRTHTIALHLFICFHKLLYTVLFHWM